MKTKFNGMLTLLLAFIMQITFAQEKKISGTVSDDTGPLPGVSIIKKGTSKGTQTDFDGKYSITAKTGDVLIYSFVGMKTIEKTVGTSSNIDITMSNSENLLDEIVVTSLGIKREKKSIGFSQQSVKGEELEKGKLQDINNALAGKVSGVQIIGNSSSTFGASEIKLRGETGVLYAVDGVLVYSITDINTDNIETMSVLKGASATAIYGPEGRNGVIVITSKSAKSGKATITIEQTTTINAVQSSALPTYQNEYGGGYSQSFNTLSYNPSTDPDSWSGFDGQLYPDYWADESWGPKLDGQLVRHWDSWFEGTDSYGELRPWTATNSDVSDFYDKAITSNTSLSFAKAGEGYNIRSSISYIDQNGIVPNSNQETVNFSLNSKFDINEKLSLTAIANYQNRTRLNNPEQNYGNLGSNFNQWWQRQLSFDRLENYENEGQVLSWNLNGPRDTTPLYWDSPYFEVYENIKNDKKDAIFGKIGINYKFNDNFNVLAELRSTFGSYSGNDRATTKSNLNTPFYSQYKFTNSKNQYFTMATYNKSFLENLIDLNIAFGGEMVNNNYDYLEVTTNGGLSIPEFYNLSGSIDPISTTDNTEIENSKTRGLFTKASVGYKNTLYLDASYRLDWSSTANASDNRVETFGISTSLLAHKFLPQNDILTFSKIRAGYAKAPYFPDAYKTSSVYEPGDLYRGNGTLSVSATQANPILTGGTRREFEIGTELKFIKNRIGLDFTYFNRLDEDLPTDISLDGSTGYTDITLNSGKTTSTGIELGLNGTIVKNENFTWDLGVNFGTLKKVVNEIYPGITSYDISTYTSNMKLQARVGENYGLFYGTDFAKHTDGSTIFTDTDTFAIASNQNLGSLLPDFTGGLSTTLNYKNFGLFLSFDGQKGGKYYSRTERYLDHSGLADYTAGLNDKGNPLRDPVASGGGIHITGVLQTGVDSEGNPISDGTVVDKYIDPQDYYNLGNLGNIYGNNVHDASYIKLRTIKFTYNFNNKLVSKIGLDKAELSFLANNVWLIYSDLPWIDPSELEKREGVNWAENGTLPRTSSYGINFKLTF